MTMIDRVHVLQLPLETMCMVLAVFNATFSVVRNTARSHRVWSSQVFQCYFHGGEKNFDDSTIMHTYLI